MLIIQDEQEYLIQNKLMIIVTTQIEITTAQRQI
jgi:hypothetical protein